MSLNGKLIEKSNIQNFLPIISDGQVMQSVFKSAETGASKSTSTSLTPWDSNNINSSLDKASTTILTNLFHSITTRAMTTEEILNEIYRSANEIEGTTDADRIKIIDNVSNYFKVVHEDYELQKDESNTVMLSQTGFSIKKEANVPESSFTLPVQPKKAKSKAPSAVNYFGFKNKFGLLAHKGVKPKKRTNPKTYKISPTIKSPLQGRKSIFNIREIVEYKLSEDLDFNNPKNRGGQTNENNEIEVDEFINVIENNKLKVSKETTSLSYMLLNNPNVRAGTKNSLELSNFLQNLSTIEMSKCYPFLDVKFLLPDTVKTKSNKIFKTASVTQFLEGTAVSPSLKTETYKVLEASYVKKTIKNGEESYKGGVETNFAAFTMPQTALNFDEEYVGHLETHQDKSNPNSTNSVKSELFKRNNIVHDYTKPFLTIKSFNVDIAPTAGLMSFKTGRLSLTLHDKARMSDIAPFIKPDLFGSFGAEVAIQYGWSHMDSTPGFSTDNITKNTNYFAEFLEQNKVYEKYIITNSSYSIDANGQVNIDLSIAMKGPIEIRAITFETDQPTAITTSTIEASQKIIDKLADKYEDTKGTEKFTLFGVSAANVNTYTANIVTEFSANTDKTKKSKLQKISNYNKIINKFQKSIKNESKLRIKIALILIALRSLDITTKYKTTAGSMKAVAPAADADAAVSAANLIDLDIATDVNGEYQKLIKFYIKIRRLASSASTYISRGRAALSKTIDGLLGKFTDGVSIEDPFFDKSNYSDVESINDENFKKAALDAKNSKNLYATTIVGIAEDKEKDAKLSDYVSLGNVVTAVLGSHLAYTASFDEIQVISYTLNDYAGLARNKNVSSLLIKKTDLENFLSQLFINGAQYTLESLLMQIVKKFITTRYCINYGLHSLYKLDENNNVKADMGKDEKSSQFQKRVDDQIFKISAFMDEKYSITSRSLISNIKFVMPKVKFLFDTMTKDDGQETILRISIIDQHDNPFESTSQIMRSIQERGIDSAIFDINSRYIDLKTKAKEDNTDSLDKLEAEFISKNQDVINKLIKAKIIKKDQDQNLVLDPDSSKSLSNSIRSQIKKIMPSVTYGTNNSAVLEASISTINEAKLNTVFLTRPDRNAAPVRTRVKFQQDLPLRILPSQVNLTIFGCPFVNYAQYIFLDFETNTTIDNQYVITGIKHDITPGKFTTTLTLAYGDAYGKYENIVNTLNRTLEQIESGTIRNIKTNSKNRPYSSSGKTNVKLDASKTLNTLNSSPRNEFSSEALKLLGYSGDEDYKTYPMGGLNTTISVPKSVQVNINDISFNYIEYRIARLDTETDDNIYYNIDLSGKIKLDIVLSSNVKSTKKDLLIDLTEKIKNNIPALLNNANLNQNFSGANLAAQIANPVAPLATATPLVTTITPTVIPNSSYEKLHSVFPKPKRRKNKKTGKITTKRNLTTEQILWGLFISDVNNKKNIINLQEFLKKQVLKISIRDSNSNKVIDTSDSISIYFSNYFNLISSINSNTQKSTDNNIILDTFKSIIEKFKNVSGKTFNHDTIEYNAVNNKIVFSYTQKKKPKTKLSYSIELSKILKLK